MHFNCDLSSSCKINVYCTNAFVRAFCTRVIQRPDINVDNMKNIGNIVSENTSKKVFLKKKQARIRNENNNEK